MSPCTRINVSHSAGLALLLALLFAQVEAAHAEDAGAGDPDWHGAAGLLIPLEQDTPVRLQVVHAKLDAMLPERTTLDAPRIPLQWEVSTVYKLQNPTDRPVELTLVQPEIPADPSSNEPVIDRVVFSLDGKRYPLPVLEQPADGPALDGVPAFRFWRRLVIELAPGEQRRVDTLFRVRGVGAADTTRIRFIEAGAMRFAAGRVGRLRYEFHLGQRAHLVEEDGRRAPLIATPPAGVTTEFFDDGDNSRLLIKGRHYQPAPTIEFALVGEGISPPGADQPSLLPRFKPLDQLSDNELKLAAMTLAALHGRLLRDAMGREVFGKLPWNDCNPAYWVAHGRSLDQPQIKQFIATHPCKVDCAEQRAKPVDPYGSRWTAPLCWYSPVRSRAKTRVHDPAIKVQLDRIDEELARRRTARKVRATQELDHVSPGCGCQLLGAARPAPAGALLLALVGLAAWRRRGRR